MSKKMQTILAIDPGDVKTAYVLMDVKTYTPIEKGLIDNEELLKKISNFKFNHLAIEMVASYGMAVGRNIFETCVWIGRFIEAANNKNIAYTKIYRIDEKINICHDSRAKDSNIRQALIDRFGEIGVKKNPGFFYGFKKDIWAAFAVGTTFIDLYNEKGLPEEDYFKR